MIVAGDDGGLCDSDVVWHVGEKGDAKKALNYIENAEKNGLVLAEALWGYTVQSTEKLLNASGLPLPWPVSVFSLCH